MLDGAACTRLARTIEEQWGPVDILVNNAGLAQVLPFAMIEEKDWDLMMDVNVKGMFLVTKAFARGMIRRKSGSIVNIGSLAGMRMLEVPVHYATAKSAVVGFTLSLARELGRYHVRVNAVVPGMLTEGVSVNVPAKQRKEYETYCALGRVGRAGRSGRAGRLSRQRPEQLHQRSGDPRRRGHLMKFRMVDRILAWEPRQGIRGVKAVSFEEYELKESLADEPCLPESLMVESLFQLGNWLVVLSSDFTEMALVVRFEEIRFVDRLRPGQSLRMEIAVRSYRSDGIVIDGQALADARTIADGQRDCLAVPVPLADYHDPDDLRVLFSEIYRPEVRGHKWPMPRLPRIEDDTPTSPPFAACAGSAARWCRARVFFRDGQVWQQSLCPACPHEPALIAADQQWYLAEVVRAHARPLAAAGARPPRLGLPARLRPVHVARLAVPAAGALDHQRLQPALPDLLHLQPRRPALPHAGRGDAAQTVDWIVESTGRVDLINITGGEPTLHPRPARPAPRCAAGRRSAGSR